MKGYTVTGMHMESCERLYRDMYAYSHVKGYTVTGMHMELCERSYRDRYAYGVMLKDIQ